MTDLTDKWKKGELPSRDDDHLWLAYYIKHKDGYIHADSLWRGYWGTAEQILAPVPSYDEWQLMQDDNKRLKHDVGNLGYKIKNQRKEIERQIAQNAQLKELLKECVEVIKNVDTYYGNYDSTNGYLVINKIDEALK